MEENFILQLLHTADQEAGLPAVQDAINFSAVLNGLEDDFENTLKISSGDIFIAGPFFNASDAVYGQAGIADILINNALGFQAVAIGNHEFDLGPGTFATLIQADPSITGPGIGPGGYEGTAFPYLSSNLDFTGEPDLQALVVAEGQAPQANSISSSVVIDVNGEMIGVVGATTPTLPSIASTGNVSVLPDGSTDIQALANQIQAAVDVLVGQGINKIILSAHMQQIAVEEQLAGLLSGVDIIIAGGSNTILANADDPLRAGDAAAGPYPESFTSASGEPVFVVNTDGNYRYVGQLVAEFDANGIITSILDESGAYATDDAGVDAVYGEDVNPEDVADPTVVEVAQAIGDVTLEREANVFGLTEVFLNGTRGDVRTQETNLGNLTADANLAIAKEYDDSVVLSLKNGGGIRDNIGATFVPAGSVDGEPVFLPPQAIPDVKEEGQISQLDIENSLRFNNGLSLLTLDAQELKQVLEHAVAATEPGATPGRFAQISGIRFSFDATQQAIEFEVNADQDVTGIAVDGERIISLELVDENGQVTDTIVADGELVGDPSRTFRIVTLNFLADGGDGYPYPLFGEDRVDLTEAAAPATNLVTFADDGSEQDALAEYLAENFPADADPGTPAFTAADTPISQDTRIVSLSASGDSYLAYELVVEGLAEIGVALPYTPVEVGGLNFGDLFDDGFYLSQNADVQQAIAGGIFTSGFDHFVQFGWLEGRDPSVLFNTEEYLAANGDVAAAVDGGIFDSALQHFALFGSAEGRDPSSLFSEADYLTANGDVAAAVQAGIFTSGFDHYLGFGSQEGRAPELALFQETFYLENNADVVAAVQAGIFTSGLDHFISFGAAEGRDPSSLFDSSAYLEANPDVAAAVAGGALPSGFVHYALFGAAEGRPAPAV